MDFEIQLTNTSGADLTDVYYYRDIDPDNDVDQGDPYGYYTDNTIVSQGHLDGASMVTSTQEGGSYFAIQAFGENSRVTHGGFDNTDAIEIYEGLNGLSQSGSSYDDVSVSVAYYFDTIADGETVTMTIRYYFGDPDGALPVVDLDANDDSGVGGNDFATTYDTVGGPIAISDVDGVILNPEGPSLDSVSISITNLLDGADEQLLFDTTDTQIVGSYDAGAGVLTLSGLDSVDNYNDVLRSIQYQNTAGAPDMTARTITVTATSDGVSSETATSTVSMITSNTAPSLATPASYTASEDQSLDLSGLSITDDALTSPLTMTFSVDTGVLSAADSAGVTVAGSGTATLTLTGSRDDLNSYLASASAPDYQGLLNDTTDATLTLTIDDGEFSDSVDVPITVSAVNDAPILDNSGFMSLTTITEDDVANDGNLVSEIIASAGGDRITDPDAGALEGIAISSFDASRGTWQYDTGSGWTDVGTVSFGQSLLLGANDRLRFVPDGTDSDTAFITFAAWDQTSGTAGTKVDASSFGGATAFSNTVGNGSHQRDRRR